MKLVYLLVLVVIYGLGILGYVGGVLVIAILGIGVMLLDLLNPYEEKQCKFDKKQWDSDKKQSDYRKSLAKTKRRSK
tara:strand:- start:571 stop:801 length:231 start_codon:yes stop_codon:yes gene_type:complete